VSVAEPKKPAKTRKKSNVLPASASTLNEFAKRVRSVLWRKDPGSEKKTYEKWSARVKELEAEYTKNQAIVRASKEFPCLHRLFREYDLREFDPNPESHAEVKHYGAGKLPDGSIEIGDEPQSYRDSLRWALDAAGRRLNGEEVTSAPCSAAFYLFRQAIEEPKDFLAKVSQLEVKADAETQAMRSARKASARAIAEIEAMLEELEVEEEEYGEIDEPDVEEAVEPETQVQGREAEDRGGQDV